MAFKKIQYVVCGQIVEHFCSTESCKKSEKAYPPIYSGFDNCVIQSVETRNSACFRYKFKKFHDADAVFTKEITNPTVSTAYGVSAVEYDDLTKKTAEKIDNGTFDWMEFNSDRKKIDEKLYNAVMGVLAKQ